MAYIRFNTVAAITLCCGIGFTLFGYDGGLLSGILTDPRFLKTFHYPSDTLLGHITATFDLGCFIGAVFSTFIGERLGRKRMMIIGCSIHAIGGLLQATAFKVEHLIAGRAVSGFGNGFVTVTIPIWQSETCSALLRGRLMVLQLTVNIGGVLIATWLNFGMRYVQSDFSWRFPLAFQCVFALSCLIMVPFLPESPRWLITKRKSSESRKVIARLLEMPLDSDEVARVEMDILAHVRHEEALKAETTWRDLFKNDELQNLKRIILGAGTQYFQQFGGINVILYYLPVLFQNSIGLSDTMSLILTGCNTINLFLATFAATFYVDTFGRKKMMFYGYLAQGICYTMVAIGLGVGTKKSQILAISFIFLYYTCFGMTNCTTAWVYPAEVNSQRYRNLGAAVATATNWISNYIVVLITPIGISNIAWRFYIIFAVFNFSFLPLIYLFYVETARFTLEEIDEIFEEQYHKRKGTTSFRRAVESPAEKEDVKIAENKFEEVDA
ncbi:general substrate transporter [Lipomyces starkeyi]